MMEGAMEIVFWVIVAIVALAVVYVCAFRFGKRKPLSDLAPDLRASELVDLHWEQVDLKGGVLHVRRVKQGSPATHPLTGRELRALRRLEREATGSPFVFVSERGAPFSTRGFQAMIERAAQAAGFD